MANSDLADLVDHDLLDEIETTLDLIEAAAATEGRLSQRDIDALLGL